MEHNYGLAKQGPSRMGYRRGCRCDECILAGEEYLAARRIRERKRKATKPERIQTHGIGGYQRGCRCSVCKTDMLDSRRARREAEAPSPALDWSVFDHLRPGVRRAK